jgi:hypothetical protein
VSVRQQCLTTKQSDFLSLTFCSCIKSCCYCAVDVCRRSCAFDIICPLQVILISCGILYLFGRQINCYEIWKLNL